jgi:hypothetical protein
MEDLMHADIGVVVVETDERSWEAFALDGGRIYACSISRPEWRCECNSRTYIPPITPEMVCPHLLAAARLPIYA